MSTKRRKQINKKPQTHPPRKTESWAPEVFLSRGV